MTILDPKACIACNNIITLLTDEIDEQSEHVVDGEERGMHHVGVHPQRCVRRYHRQTVQHRLLVRAQR